MLAGAVAILAVATAVAADKYPYVGVVTGEEVYVRSGGDTNYYPVLKVSRGQRVTVQGDSSGWLKIAPLPGTFSYVDKAYVQRSGDTGTVTAERALWVRAGSLLSNERSTPQVKLNKGDTVTILGEDEGFYKIQTPATAVLWISARYVVSEDQAANIPVAAAGSRPAGAAGSQPSLDSVTAGRAASKTPGIITRSAAPGKAAAAAPAKAAAAPTASRNRQQDFDVLEADLKQEMAKPLTERNWEPLIGKYQALAAQREDDAVAAAAKIRVENLSSISQQKEVFEAVERADRMFKSEMDIMNRPLPTPATQQAKERGWDAQGTLKASWVFTGLNTPKLYRLVNPMTDTAVAYVQTTPQLAEKLESMVDQYVGVRAAQMNFRPEWNVNLIVPVDVTKMEAPAGAATQPMEAMPMAAGTQPEEEK